MLYSAAGRQRVLDLPAAANFSANGNPTFGWRRLRLSDAIATADPGSRLASAITDGGAGSGIVFPLTGGWGSTDWSGAYPFATWRLSDLYDAPIGASSNIVFTVGVRLWTSLAATDEFVIGVALASENTLTGTTVEAKGIYMVGTGAGSNLATGNCSSNNGSGTQSNGTMTSGVVSAVGSLMVHGDGGGRLYANGSLGVDGSWGAVGGGVAALGAVTLAAQPSQWYLHAFAGRLSAGAAGAISPAADFFISPVAYHHMVITT